MPPRRSNKRILNIKVLPGEPTDGSGRVCIHLFVHDPAGPIVARHALHPVLDADGKPMKRKIVARPTRGRMACNRKVVARPTRDNVVTSVLRTDDPRAATCPACLASDECKAILARLNNTNRGDTDGGSLSPTD